MPADTILPHEIADPGREQRIERRLHEDGILRDPLLVGAVRDTDEYVLLDGTNRRMALASLELPWSLVQIIDYSDRNAVELRTWCHAAPLNMRELLSAVRVIPGVRVSAVPALESADALTVPGTLALILDGRETAALSLETGFTGSRAEKLRQFVELYEGVLTRIDCEPDDLEERARSLRAVHESVLIAFPRFTRSQVVTMAARELLIPAGITRHVILSGRALRVNVPLDVLRAPTLEDAREQLSDHVARLQPRIYRETTILYDS